jgi:hypothetical protein
MCVGGMPGEVGMRENFEKELWISEISELLGRTKLTDFKLKMALSAPHEREVFFHELASLIGEEKANKLISEYLGTLYAKGFAGS